MGHTNALIIASVTAVLKRLLDNALAQQFAQTPVGTMTVTALPPDRIPTGAEEITQLNLYLYRITPNLGGPMGIRPLATQNQEPREETYSLALNLHYLLTAYGEHDFQAEILLGSAIQFFQALPILSPTLFRTTLATLTSGNTDDSTSALLTDLASSPFIETFPSLKITPEFLSMEDLSRIWSSLQTRARPTMTYQVSTILITKGSGSIMPPAASEKTQVKAP